MTTVSEDSPVPLPDDSAPEVDRDEEARAQSPAHIPFEARGVDLPADPESLEFSQSLQNLKHLFGSRTEYNYMVCDQLALRGVAPNGLNVRRAGSWGAPVAVGADVKAWYTALSSRLSSEHAKIPEAAKRSANSLFEQLWALAAESIGKPLDEQLTAERQAVKEQSEAFAQEIEHLRRELDIAQGNFQEAQQHIDQAKKEIEGLETVRQDLVSEVDMLGRSISQAALEHEQARRELERSHNQAIERMRASAEAAAAVQAKEIEQARAQVQAERDRADQAARSHALAIDGFRQDIRRAVERGDKAMEEAAQERAAASSLRERLAASNLEKAALEQKLSRLGADLSALQQAVSQLEPKAWMHVEDSSLVISDSRKQSAIRDGGESAASVRLYAIALSSASDIDLEKSDVPISTRSDLD